MPRQNRANPAEGLDILASTIKSASATHSSSLAAEAAGRAGEVRYNRCIWIFCTRKALYNSFKCGALGCTTTCAALFGGFPASTVKSASATHSSSLAAGAAGRAGGCAITHIYALFCTRQVFYNNYK